MNEVREPLNHCYQIQVRGHLSSQWSEWFDGFVIKLEENGDTCLTGNVVDQAALYGLLKKMRDLGLPLISLNRVDSTLPNQANS